MSISAIIFTALVPIVIGLVAYIFRRLDKSLDGLTQSNEKLSGTVSGLRATMMAQDDMFQDFKIRAEKTHEKQDDKLDNHETRISVIESK